jgi:protein SCO1
VAAPAPAEPRHALRGEIIAVKPEVKVLVIQHEAIPGYMPAMTMEFTVGTGDLANAKPGQRIRGEMYVRDGTAFLEKIWPDDSATVRQVEAATKALAQDTSTRGREVYREVGETAPDFTLLDQDGRAVATSRFRGRYVVLNFIFTRCPIATMCPASTQHMAALQKAARAAGITDLALVSISLDPEYDTPGVLKEYAVARGLDLTNWSFLTGPDTAVRQLLAQLGVLREFEGDTIKHTLATLLIDPQGRIVHRIDGSIWEPRDFLEKIRRP